MALPMLGGTFAMNAFNLTDTWFVSRLGTLPLAAMGFSFPVVMLLVSITHGLGTGATAVVSHALGRHDHEAARRITTHTLILGILLVLCLSVGGLLTIGPVFTMLGAGEEVLPLIRQYMTIWYIGIVFLVLPMMGSDIVRATGDTVSPSFIMVLSAVLNMILDPIMIFGFLGCPAMGIRGAALATVISQASSAVWLVYLLYRKHRLLAWGSWNLAQYMLSLRQIMSFAVPSVLSLILMPVSASVITRLLSHFGNEAVAAAGAASRIEMFAFMVPMTLGVSLVPFVGQNFGARRLDRVGEGIRFAYRFSLFYGLAIGALCCCSAGSSSTCSAWRARPGRPRCCTCMWCRSATLRWVVR